VDDEAWEKYYRDRETRQKWSDQRNHFIPSSVSSTETPPPADFSAHGREGAKVKRAVIQQRLTATERKAYRSGYQAGHKLRQRWLEALERVLRSLQREG
jgi:hypothetical protein